ncbi:site-specific integrase [Pedobacter mucosus]|uniref:site-specific integrase n=1 Tax=Pedobacter mucosus TaxID=2895286 RepID=UPI001EE47D64|nr:site-specific integrase [Pedobacter mucosus]UKT65104.1 site-specific integrase [Pedobacter mucosus]
MATVATSIKKSDKKSDGTWNVKVRIWHNSKAAYIDTVHYVTLKQLGKKSKESDTLVIKDKFILDRIAPDLKKYRDWISDHSELIDKITAGQLRDSLVSLDKHNKPDQIDFLEFCNNFISAKQNSPKASSARTLATVRNSLMDYFRLPFIPITEINFNFLKSYELYLRQDRELTRRNHSGNIRTYIQKGLSDSGLHNHMRDLRLLFNEARNIYNDEDLGTIKIFHYPFKKYKVGSAPVTAHRDRPVSEIIKFRDADLPPNSRAELARDLAMLSLYLLGMNAADLYELPTGEKIRERIDYNRAKTRNKRKDKAFFSVKVIREARPLLDKYAGKLQQRYSTREGLNQALDEGLKVVSQATNIPGIDFYDMRHCVGTWARRKCGYSKDDVAEALNQTDRTVTDTYIAQDWDLIDSIQDDVVKLLSNYSKD